MIPTWTAVQKIIIAAVRIVSFFIFKHDTLLFFSRQSLTEIFGEAPKIAHACHMSHVTCHTHCINSPF